MKVWWLSFILLFMTNIVNAEVIETESPRTIKIVTKTLVPFVIPKGNNEFEGFSIDLWKEISEKLNIDYEIKQVDTVTKLLYEVKTNKADVGLAGISMTANREKDMDFSYSFFDSGLQIMVANNSDKSSFDVVIDILLSFFQLKMLLVIGVLLLTLFIAGNIIWLTQRHKNPEEFSPIYKRCYGWFLVGFRNFNYSWLWRSSTSWIFWSFSCFFMDVYRSIFYRIIHCYSNFYFNFTPIKR